MVLIGLVLWSFTSGGIIVAQYRYITAKLGQLAETRATLFAYEVRYDKVFEQAYPGNNKSSIAGASSSEASIDSTSQAKLAEAPNTSTANQEPPAAKASGTTPTPATTKDLPTANPGKLPTKPATDTTLATSNPTPLPAVKANPEPATETNPTMVQAEPKPQDPPAPQAGTSQVQVNNAVIEPRARELEIRFDLSNKSEKGRAEGYIWAIAEFKDNNGQTRYLGAPKEIAVSAQGEPSYPKRSNLFGIRYYKRKSFVFPVAAQDAGTFTSIRIGLLDMNTNTRTDYNIPIEIKYPLEAASAKPSKGT